MKTIIFPPPLFGAKGGGRGGGLKDCRLVPPYSGFFQLFKQTGGGYSCAVFALVFRPLAVNDSRGSYFEQSGGGIQARERFLCFSVQLGRGRRRSYFRRKYTILNIIIGGGGEDGPVSQDEDDTTLVLRYTRARTHRSWSEDMTAAARPNSELLAISIASLSSSKRLTHSTCLFPPPTHTHTHTYKKRRNTTAYKLAKALLEGDSCSSVQAVSFRRKKGQKKKTHKTLSVLL